jgi:hypothetical protein
VDKNGLGGLTWAAAGGHVGAIRTLAKAGCDVSLQNAMGYSPVLACCEYNQTDSLAALIELKANVNGKMKSSSGYSYSPFHFVAQKGEVHMLAALLAANADINARDSNLRTPVMIALAFGQPEAALLLLKHDACDTGAKDFGAVSVQDWAVVYAGKAHCDKKLAGEITAVLEDTGPPLRFPPLPAPPAFDAAFLDQAVVTRESEAQRATHTCPQCCGLVLTAGRTGVITCPRCMHRIVLREESEIDGMDGTDTAVAGDGESATTQLLPPGPSSMQGADFGSRKSHSTRTYPRGVVAMPDYLLEEPEELQAGWYRNETRLLNMPYAAGRNALMCRGCLIACTPITNVLLSLYMLFRMRFRESKESDWSQPKERWDIAWFDTKSGRQGIALGWILWLFWFPLFIGSSSKQEWFVGGLVGIFCGFCFCLVCCWNSDVYCKRTSSYHTSTEQIDNIMIGGGDCWFYGCDINMSGGRGRGGCCRGGGCEGCDGCCYNVVDSCGTGCQEGCSHICVGCSNVFQGAQGPWVNCIGTHLEGCSSCVRVPCKVPCNAGDCDCNCGRDCDCNCGRDCRNCGRDCDCICGRDCRNCGRSCSRDCHIDCESWDCGGCDCGGCDCGGCDCGGCDCGGCDCGGCDCGGCDC